MLEQELQLERNLFFSLNGSNSVIADYFFWIYSGQGVWLPFYLCVLFVLVYKKNWEAILLILLSLTCVILLCDQISSGIFKPVFHRFRPTHHVDFQEQVKILFGYRGGKYGFISSHACNAFGFAVFTAMLFKNRFFTWTVLLFAMLNAYSRIYMGVHFISDVAAGALIGALIGFGVYRILVFCQNKIEAKNKYQANTLFFSKKFIYALCIVYFIEVMSFLLCAIRLKGINT